VAIPAVEKKAIEQALGRFDEEFRDQPQWAGWESNRAHKFAIRVDGKLYPAKKIVSLATSLAVRDFTGGKPTNGYLRARNFEIVDLRVVPKLEFVKGEIYDRQTEIHGPFGGSSQSGIAPSNKAPAIFLFSGESGEQYGYTDKVDAHGVYSYAGEGQVGNMALTRGNLAVQQHAATGRTLHLFKTLGKGKGQLYVGEYVCADISWQDGLDRNRETRKIVIFHLVPVADLALHELEPNDHFPAEIAEIKIDALRKRAYEAAVASVNKGKSTSTRTIHVRSQAVKDYVLNRAGGICESCARPAPFTTKSGSPYLEPHHINRLSDGGLDHPKYIGAICPTCHKEIHYGSEGDAKNNLLREAVNQKELVALAKGL
jgi:5-methylcytosine-specific restriction protein A